MKEPKESDASKEPASKEPVYTLHENKLTMETFTAKDFIISQLYIYRLKLTGATDISLPKKRKTLRDIDKAVGLLKNKIEHIHFSKAPNQVGGVQYVFTMYENIDHPTKLELDNIFIRPDSITRHIVRSFLYPEQGVIDDKDKIGKFKRSGHLTDQILKYNYPKDKSAQLSIFESLQEKTQRNIEEVAGVEAAQTVEGIKLSPSETKVIDCLCKLLHENSQTTDKKRQDYYSGNIGYELVEYGGDQNTPAPKLAFTLYELTREYKGGETIGGKDVDNVKQILTELDSKRFLLSYVETTKKKDGSRIERKIEDFRKLIHILQISQTEYSKEDIELSKKEETVILLNPIFRRQIDSKFILYPNDINRRTIIAYGSHNLSDVALRLRDYLIRELSSKRYQPEINLDKLYYLLAEKWMRESRRKKVKEYTEKALETVKALGLLLSYEIKTASTGEPKVVFTLNKDWE
jgi:hypothetical protein